MTFLIKECIKDNVVADFNDDWEIDPDNGTCNFQILGLDKLACRYFNIEDFDAKYPDGWINKYVVVDPCRKAVIRLEFYLQLNCPEDEMEGEGFVILVSVRNEAEELYKLLLNNDEDDKLKDFFTDSAVEIAKSKMAKKKN